MEDSKSVPVGSPVGQTEPLEPTGSHITTERTNAIQETRQSAWPLNGPFVLV
jgi:hypothetical protein